MTLAELCRGFIRCGHAGGRAPRASTLRIVEGAGHFHTYVDTTPAPGGESLPDDVAWSWDPSAGRNQHPDHCGTHASGDPLAYQRRIGHRSLEDAYLWASVYTSGCAGLVSDGTLMAVRVGGGTRDDQGPPILFVRRLGGELSAVNRKHRRVLLEARAEFSRSLVPAVRPRYVPHVIVAPAVALEDALRGPRWACEIIRQDGGDERCEVRAFYRGAAWDVLRSECVRRMADGEARAPQAVSLRPVSAAVDLVRTANVPTRRPIAGVDS